MNVMNIAQACHTVNKAFCESIGDNSQVEWSKAPQALRQSAIDGVYFHLSNPLAKPSASHANWLKFKTKAGWVYGEVKDIEAKVHPCMVPFEDLPPEQQSKDHLFKAVVHALMPFLD